MPGAGSGFRVLSPFSRVGKDEAALAPVFFAALEHHAVMLVLDYSGEVAARPESREGLALPLFSGGFLLMRCRWLRVVLAGARGPLIAIGSHQATRPRLPRMFVTVPSSVMRVSLERAGSAAAQ